MKKKPIIEIKVNSWNKRTARQQTKAISWLQDLILDLYTYRKKGISDDFWGHSN